MYTPRKSAFSYFIVTLFTMFMFTPLLSVHGFEPASQRMKNSVSDSSDMASASLSPVEYSSNVVWEKAPSLVINDTGHAHTYNGKIYFVGGSAVQEYDPTQNAWTIINNQGIGYNPYRGGSALIDDEIYMIHGWTAEKTTVYNITANQFSNFPTADYNRLDVAVATLNGIIYVSGGWKSGNINPTQAVRGYNSQNESWFPVEPLGTARKDHEMVSSGGYLYVIGGVLGNCPVERYDPELKQWEEIGEGPAYQEFGATIIQEGDIFIGGPGEGSTKIYDFQQNQWYQGPFNEKGYDAYGANSLAYLDGYVYSIGARDSPGNYYGFVWKVKSTIPPFIDHPNNLKISEDALGPISVVWSPLDNNPASYNLTQNEELIEEGSWDGGLIHVNVDNLAAGNYTFVCTVMDQDGNTATDLARVEVLPSTTQSTTQSSSPWDFTLILLIQFLGLVVLRRRIPKDNK